jgi:hypothetical protein
MATSTKGAYVNRRGYSPNTVSEISSKTKIYAKDADLDGLVQVGVIASFDPNESRNIEPVRGIGFGDQVAELIPGVTEPMTISVVRTAQYLSSIYQVFGYTGGVSGLVRSLKHHRWPFDVKKETVFSEIVNSDAAQLSTVGDETTPIDSGDGYKALVTYYEGCWFSSWSTSYSSDTALVQENCEMMVSDVWDGTNQVAISGIQDTGNKLTSQRFGGK